MKDHTVKSIDYSQCKEWLLKKHYARRMCSISYSFGLFDPNLILIGVCTFGSPPSRALCVGVCGEALSSFVLELNRLVLRDNQKNQASFFISRCLSLLPPSIVVSYADTSHNHHGYVYQATNWIYTGLSAKRTERYDPENPNMHSKWLVYQDLPVRDRPQKHRYVTFTGTKRDKKRFMMALNYEQLSYPKGDNVEYDASYEPITQAEMF